MDTEKIVSDLISEWTDNALAFKKQNAIKTPCSLTIGAPKSILWDRLKTEMAARSCEDGEYIDVEITSIVLCVNIKRGRTY